MHWVRVEVDSREVVGRRDNAIRAGIDALARKAGLDFIVNIIMDSRQRVLDCVAGDLVEAHREGCLRARRYHEVRIPHQADIVVVDGYPFDIEFWQVNKAVDTAGLVVRQGGAVICVSPCYEGFSRTHADVLLKYGYRPREEIVQLVASGAIEHKVVGVHMVQVAEVAVDRATLYLVSRRDLARGCGAGGAALCGYATRGAGPGFDRAGSPSAGGGVARRRRDVTRGVTEAPDITANLGM